MYHKTRSTLGAQALFIGWIIFGARGASADDAVADADPDAGGVLNGSDAPPLPTALLGTSDTSGLDMRGEHLEGPISGGGDANPYECISEQVQSAVKCGTEWVTDASVCGYKTVRDAALCGTEVIEDAATCGTHAVQDAVRCGTAVVSSAACGVHWIEDAAVCGTTTIENAAICGLKTITDAFTCGFETVAGWITGEPKSCSVANSCEVPAMCVAFKACEVPQTCEVANTCTVGAECSVAATCEAPKRCEVEVCKQTAPGGRCTPGLAECDIEGFTCQPSADADIFRCLPSYDREMDVQDQAICEAQYDPSLAALAQDTGDTMAFSFGGAGAAVAAGSYEVGTVYGENGEYGCFASTCVGAQTDVNINAFANLGSYTHWSAFAGTAKTFAFGASVPFVELGFTTAAVTSAEYDEYVGQIDTVSLGVGVVPAQVAHMSCNTTVYQTRAARSAAFGKAASQSSSYPGGDAARAVDGNLDGDWQNGSVTHTLEEFQPWWQVDLGQSQPIESVTLYNRTDCCSERLRDFKLLLSEDGDAWREYEHPSSAGQEVTFTTDDIARFVKVQLNGTGYLSLAEVEVF